MIPALPAALAGITWFLFYNGHNSGVPALMRSHCVWELQPQTASSW
jgi:hypothetical protein